MTNGANAGKIALVPKGDYNSATTYERLSIVSHKSKSWIAKKTCVGIEPSKTNSAYWHEMAGHTSANNLTTTEAGYVLDARQGKVLKDALDDTSAGLAVERARIDSFVTLSEGSTTGDAELIDARIGADGKRYTNLGEANRTQFANLKSDLSKLCSELDKEYTLLPVTFTIGYAIDATTGFSYSRAFSAMSDFIKNEGNFIKFNGNLTDSDGKQLLCYVYEYETSDAKSYLSKRHSIVSKESFLLSAECGYFRIVFTYKYGESSTIDETVVNDNCIFLQKLNINNVMSKIEDGEKKTEEILSIIPNSSILFFDDFSGDTLDTTKWNYGGLSTSTDEIPSKMENVSIEDGKLKLRTHKITDGENTTWSIGNVSTFRKFSYGQNVKVTVKAKFPNVKGSWSCIWSYSDNFVNFPNITSQSTWPYGGEIDISEKMGLKNETNASIHFHNGVESDKVTAKSPITSDDYHEYWCIHNGNEIILGVDDMTTLTTDISTFDYNGFNPFKGEQVSQFLILGLQVGKDGEYGFAPAPDETTPDEFYAYFDYVKVEALTPKHSPMVMDLGIEDEITILVGKNKVLRPCLDELSQDRTIYYHSLNPDICTISNEGKIKGLSEGTTFIYAMTHGTIAKRIKVTVSNETI